MPAALLEAIEAGRTLLAPNAQLAALLADRLQRHYLRESRGCWPTPQIRDFSGWVRQLYERQCFDTAGAPRVLEDLEEKLLWRAVVADSPRAVEFADITAAARAAREAWRAMQEFDISLQALAHQPGIEAQALYEWCGRFQARCRDLNAVPLCELPGRLTPPTEAPVPLGNSAWTPNYLSLDAGMTWLKTSRCPRKGPPGATGASPRSSPTSKATS